MGLNGQSGKVNLTRYMFYDKTKELNNQGWFWFHHTLPPEAANKLLRDELQPKFGNEKPEGKGFVTILQQKVLFQYFPRNKDDRNRDHWVLLLAWPPANMKTSELWSVFDDEVFGHVGSGQDDIPKVLSIFEYNPNYVKLTYTGGKGSVERENGRGLVEKAEDEGLVSVAFYCERPNGKADIITQPVPPKV